VYHFIGGHVLGDAAGFAGGYVRLTDIVEQRRFTVVDVTHYRDYRRARSGCHNMMIIA
jgi:hypothetical protein